MTDDDYDPIADVWKSVAFAFETIRERKKNGGPGWIPGERKAPKMNACEECGEEDISPNVEAFEVSGKCVCDDCADGIFEAADA